MTGKNNRFQGSQKILFLLLLFSIFPLLHSSLARAQDWLYTVQPGDNLWTLCRQHLREVKMWQQVQKVNGIEDPMNLKPGSVIRFPLKLLKKGAAVGRIEKVRGRAMLIGAIDGKSRPVYEGMQVWGNSVLKTEDGSSASIIFADGSRMLIQENSSLKLENITGYSDTNLIDTSAELESGRIHNRVSSRRERATRFEIATPSAVAAVRGTEYRLSAEDNGRSHVEVLQGEVAVDSSGTTLDVNQGFGTIAFTEKRPTPPVKLLDPPEFHGLEKVISRVPFPVRVHPLAAATFYRLQISEDADFGSLLFDKLALTPGLMGPILADGNYYLRVHGIDSQGLEGLDRVHPFTIWTQPESPILLKPQSEAQLQAGAIDLEWSRPEEVVSFNLQVARDSGFQSIIVERSGLGELSFTLSDELQPGVYFWRLASTDANGRKGPYGDGSQFRVMPPMPEFHSLATESEGPLILRWPQTGPDYTYRCQIADERGFSAPLVDEAVTEAQYSAEKLEPGNYMIRVALVDKEGYTGPFSRPQHFQVPPDPESVWALIVSGLVMLFIML